MLDPVDRGPVYIETDFTRFPVEPWNTFSEFVVLLVALYWIRALGRAKVNLPVSQAASYILILQFIGATVYHATRSHWFWLVLDVVPILLFVLLVSLYLARWIYTKRFKWAVVVTLIYSCGVYPLLEIQKPLSMYLVLAFGISLIMLFVSCLNNCLKLADILGALLFFGLALYFREVDELRLLPMGTHFLWHIFAGISSWFVLAFCFAFEKSQELYNKQNE